jgi:hypothetical protein
MRTGFLFAALAVVATAFADDSFRCGQWIISRDLSVAELRHKCGEPASRESETVDVRGRTASGGSVKRGTSTTERWTYVLGSGARYVVTIVDGEIRSIESSN